MKKALTLLILAVLLTRQTIIIINARDQAAPVITHNRTMIVDTFEQAKQLRVSVTVGESVTYKLRTCEDKDAICSITLTAGVIYPPLSRRMTSTESTTATLVCRLTLHNALGGYLAHLEEQTPATFFDQTGKAPFRWNALPAAYTGTTPRPGPAGLIVALPAAYTGTTILTSWGGILTTVSPTVGISTAAGYAKVWGNLYYIGQESSHEMFTFVDGNGWFCSGA